MREESRRNTLIQSSRIIILALKLKSHYPKTVQTMWHRHRRQVCLTLPSKKKTPSRPAVRIAVTIRKLCIQHLIPVLRKVVWQTITLVNLQVELKKSLAKKLSKSLKGAWNKKKNLMSNISSKTTFVLRKPIRLWRAKVSSEVIQAVDSRRWPKLAKIANLILASLPVKMPEAHRWRALPTMTTTMMVVMRKEAWTTFQRLMSQYLMTPNKKFLQRKKIVEWSSWSKSWPKVTLL